MDRAAPPNPPPDPVPPVEWASVRKVGTVGVALAVAAAVAAAVVGLGVTAAGSGVPAFVEPVRVLLVFAAVLAAGSAVSMRPDRWQAWALGAGTAVVSIIGLPAEWDSFRLFFAVLTGVAATGAVVAAVSPEWRVRAATVLILFHFGGIFLATTAPQPTPWLNEQIFQRVYNPYLQFIYMRNAYHFYSPEPGPASLVCCLLKTETGEETLPDGTKRKAYAYKWIVLPKRPADMKDPLGLAYYRRLSLTEQIARGTFEASLPASFERGDANTRRREAGIPSHPVEPPLMQYKVPHSDLIRYLLPSYARHLILENTADAAAAGKSTIKIYRLEHRTLSVDAFRTGTNPYAPPTYRAYFLGEFDAFGTLVDPQERMLYWLVPVIARVGPASPDPKQKPYLDYLSAHALGVRIDDLDKPENAPNVMNWDQLR